MDESAIMNQIGIKNSSHRAKIVSSLVLLRAKHNLRKCYSLPILNTCLKWKRCPECIAKVTGNCLMPDVAGYKKRVIRSGLVLTSFLDHQTHEPLTLTRPQFYINFPIWTSSHKMFLSFTVLELKSIFNATFEIACLLV